MNPMTPIIRAASATGDASARVRVTRHDAPEALALSLSFSADCQCNRKVSMHCMHRQSDTVSLKLTYGQLKRIFNLATVEFVARERRRVNVCIHCDARMGKEVFPDAAATRGVKGSVTEGALHARLKGRVQ